MSWGREVTCEGIGKDIILGGRRLGSSLSVVINLFFSILGFFVIELVFYVKF